MPKDHLYTKSKVKGCYIAPDETENFYGKTVQDEQQNLPSKIELKFATSSPLRQKKRSRRLSK
jgi:hypothetical protein